MAVKTITIDMEAYNALRRRKKSGQSFSDVIKEHFSAGLTGAELKRALADLTLDDSTLEAAERIVEARGSDPASAPDL